MICPNCGAENQGDNAVFCANCGAKIGEGGDNSSFNSNSGGSNNVRPEKFESYFVHSILVLVLCCVPFGIAALINATKAKGSYESGNYAEAEENAAKAKKWCIYGVVGGVVFSIIYAIFVVMTEM